jgi:hypothetical protein
MVGGSAAKFDAGLVKLLPPEQMQWTKFPKSFVADEADRPSLGVIVGQPMPGPSDLAREKQINGKALTLVDGRQWLIPHARVISGDGYNCNLPVSFDLHEETGEWILNQVQLPYRAIWNHANAYESSRVEAMIAAKPGESITWTIPDGEQMVADALAVNYRVSARELATMGLLVTGLASDVARVLVDDDGWQQLKKKAAPDTGVG